MFPTQLPVHARAPIFVADSACQVPVDLVDILNDPTLFSNNGEITTKEIIKKYGDRTMRYGDAGDAGRPIARRVETEPPMWQHDMGARPIHDTAMPFASPGVVGGGGNPGTPPPTWRAQEDGRSSPYSQHMDASGGGASGDDRRPRREWRNSGWGRQNSNSVAAGLT
jgi:hypothetical protein